MLKVTNLHLTTGQQQKLTSHALVNVLHYCYYHHHLSLPRHHKTATSALVVEFAILNSNIIQQHLILHILEARKEKLRQAKANQIELN